MIYEKYESGVYSITDLSGNCIYVGATRNFYERFRQHLKMLFDKTHHNTSLQDYCNKVGIDNLKFSPVFACAPGSIFFYEKIYSEILRPFCGYQSTVLPPMEVKYRDEIVTIITSLGGGVVTTDQVANVLNASKKRAGMVLKSMGVKRERDKSNRALSIYKIPIKYF